jgi:hypothetical protein
MSFSQLLSVWLSEFQHFNLRTNFPTSTEFGMSVGQLKVDQALSFLINMQICAIVVVPITVV